MAQQQQQQTTPGTGTTTPAARTTPPLTPEEQREQDRLQNVTTAITRNLQQGEMKINGIIYTPRWSNPVWVQPNSLSVLFTYCLPGEFADSGQQILGSRDLQVLESYSLALSPVLTGWLMVVENENQTERSPAAVGVICASDANDPQTRILSPQEQTVIKNLIQQFITIRNIQKTNITQVINIINNITSNQTTGVGGGGGNNQTGNQTGGGGVNTTEPLTVNAILADIDQDENPVVVFESDIEGGTPPYTCHWDLGDGTTIDECGGLSYIYRDPGEYIATLTATDATGQTASDNTGSMGVTIPSGNQIIGGTNTEGIPSNIHPPVIYQFDDETVQATSPEGASVSFNEVRALEYFAGENHRVPVSCDHESGETFPIGETVVTCTAIGTEVEPGQRYTTQESFTITVVEELPTDGEAELATNTAEEPPAADGAVAEPLTNDTAG
jgi:PKD repeat protein